MSEKLTAAIERLEELLEAKDNEISELQDQVTKFKDLEEREFGWCRHESFEKDVYKLPLPRLEIIARQITDNWDNFEWLYYLVYPHLLEHIIKVPLGRTTSQGGRGLPPIYTHQGGEILAGTVITPFREGAHLLSDMEKLKLRGFYIIEEANPHEPGARPYIVEMMRDGTGPNSYTQKVLP